MGFAKLIILGMIIFKSIMKNMGMALNLPISKARQLPHIKAKEARRKNPPTAYPNPQNYARCEWKCFCACRQRLVSIYTLVSRVKTLQRTAGRLFNWK